MGEVYRSRDVRLGRDVAVKVVSSRIAADADAAARFEREARALAALNHPNIAAIYDVIEHSQQPALVLELVEGETLADRLAARPLSVAETLHVARQLTDALDSAHEAGIVHRDLKPANIKITEAGQVKILDFGLAKAIAVAAGQGAELDSANTPTITVHGTRQGVILGTAAYMSPEQARGKRIDKRTDIWAFGCVLFEMLTGKRAFDGETTSDMIAAILERTPDLRRLPKDTPASVRRVIARCLEKDPKRRARDIAEVRVALDDDAAAAKTSPTPPWLAFATGAAVIAVIGTAAWYGAGRGELRPTAPAEAEFVLPISGIINPADSWAIASPDGRRLAFVVRSEDREPMIWIRSLHSARPTPLAGTEGVAGQVFWSPDGRHLGFRAGGRLKRVPVDGGPVQVICPLSVHVGATWSKDDVIVLAPANRDGLYRVPASGGTLEAITKIDPKTENSHRWPHFLPDGRHFIFTVRTDRGINNALRLGSLDSANTTVLVESQSNAVYADGYLLYVKDGALLAHPFDPAALALHGSARAVAGPVLQNTSSAVATFSASADGGLLAYVAGPRPPSRLMWFDRTGKTLSQVGAERIFLGVALSHDETRALFETIDAEHGTRDIWVIDIATGATTRVTNHPATDWFASWSPDDREIVFASDRAGQSTIFTTTSDGSGEAQLVYRGDIGVFAQAWLPDGRLLFYRDARDASRSLMALTLGGQTPPATLLTLPFTRINGTVSSRDGRWLAFAALESSGFEVYVTSFSGGQRHKVSTQGGVQPSWRRDGRELFFATPQGDIMSVAVSPGPVFGQPVRLMRPCQTTTPPSAFTGGGLAFKSFDTSGDGQRVLAICETVGNITNVTVALGWQSRLADGR
jgi:Tol biopolymer transport system component